MAQIGPTWVSTSWVSVGGWATGSWGTPVPTPTVEEPAGGGRRIYDPDDRKTQRQRTRKLNKREREDLDRMLAHNAAPRYVAPTPELPVPVKRTAPYVAPVEPKRTDRIVAAKQFMALDAIDNLLADMEREQSINAQAVEVAHIRAKQHADWLRLEHQRSVAVELARRAEAERVWLALEAERIRQEDEDEMMQVLLAIHEVV